jgi:plasmid stabilization system protein ParE
MAYEGHRSRKGRERSRTTFSWIAKDNPRAASAMVCRIRDRINALELDSLAHMGRRGFVAGTLELVEYPYIIIYRVDDARREVVVLEVVHRARNLEERGI